MSVRVEKIKQRVEQLHEVKPMLGFRGCRLDAVGLVVQEIVGTCG